jgi:chromosome partitioning protein
VSLAAALAEAGRRVLLVDLDPQYSATTWLSTEPVGRGVFDLFADPGRVSLAGLARPTVCPGLDLVGASAWLVGAEKALANEPGAETIFREKLAEVPPGRYDYALLDCPPTLGVLTVNALTAARELLVPVECHVMGLQGLAQLLQTVEVVRKRLNPGLRLSGVLACRLDARTKHGVEVVEKLRGRFPQTLRAVIRENVRLAECPSMGEPITTYAPQSSGAEDYRRAAAEVMAQEGEGHEQAAAG